MNKYVEVNEKTNNYHGSLHLYLEVRCSKGVKAAKKKNKTRLIQSLIEMRKYNTIQKLVCF